ncbi:caspase domain-containing protein [Lactarius sanguifluus]|nr:caspase domain-containing protein [Lactarius sanguifluus]
MSIPFPQPQYAQPITRPPSNAPTLIQFPTVAFTSYKMMFPLTWLSCIMPSSHGHRSRSHSHSSSHRDHHHRHSHGRTRSSSRAPSPAPPPGFIPSPSPTPIVQGHHYRPRTHSHSSDNHHHHRHRSRSSQRHSHSRSHSHSRHRSHSVTHAPPILISHNSEPIAPYMLVPTTAYTASEYQQPYVTQPNYGPPLTPAATAFPMPRISAATASHGIPSPRFLPTTGAPPAPSATAPVQNRALRVPHFSRSQPHKSLLAQEVDAKATSYGLHSHPLFRHSRCTGNRKAVCVGINYTGQKNELQGCVNDAQNIFRFLTEKYRYSRSNVIVLTDDATNPRMQPTRKNMLNAMRWLVEDACPDDALFIHYSGHGGRTRDQNGDEIDGWDEVIFPVDYKTTGIITDDELHKALVDPLPPGCRLTSVFDSCHSASVLDLPFEYHSNGKLKSSPVSPAFLNTMTSPADVVSFSGSMDSQTSADVVQGGVAVGAMSYALLKVLNRNPRISYLDLLRGIRAILSTKYSQKPQLSSSHIMDMGLQFTM